MSTQKERAALRAQKRQTRAVKEQTAAIKAASAPFPTGVQPPRMAAPASGEQPDTGDLMQMILALSEQMTAFGAHLEVLSGNVKTHEVPIGGLVRGTACPECGDTFMVEEQTTSTDPRPHAYVQHEMICASGHRWRVTVSRIRSGE
jgi:hypothetical protein